MTELLTRGSEPLVAPERARAVLDERLAQAALIAGRSGQAVASATFEVDPGADAAAAIFAARRPGDRFSCFEQPDRDGYAVCGLGAAAVLRAAGPDRFTAAAAAARALARDTITEPAGSDPRAPAGSGPVFAGGFAFAGDGGRVAEWRSFAPAQLVLPELSIARGAGEARVTVNVLLPPGDDPATALDAALARLGELRPAAMPLLDPDPIERATVSGAAPPAHYEDAVGRAVRRIRAGELAKVVLAREVRVHTARQTDAASIHDALRAAFPGCYCYAVGTGEAAFVGASPELLVRRDGARAQTVALAGTTRRSADPAVDDHLGEQLLQSSKDRGEQAIVTRRIERALEPVSVWVAAAPEPALVKVQNVQHLATPIRAQLTRPLPAVELAGLLHPTPAVGGEPPAAVAAIPALEGLDRGWYAGAVGWTDLAEDGEFCVALRCALLHDRIAHLYAGCGIVADSVPADELAESEVKLQALLPLLV